MASLLRKVVITGGPCSGKTSVLPAVSAALKTRGWQVYCIPEMPTIVQAGGCEYPGPEDSPRLRAFELALMRMQLAAEESFASVAASTGRPSVILNDRALLDISAYMSAALWGELLAECGLEAQDVLARYDGAVHMVTAADGAEEFYTLANNAARTESVETARALDAAVLKAWAAHRQHTVVRNPATGGFPAKQSAVVDAVAAAVGPLPPPHA